MVTPRMTFLTLLDLFSKMFYETMKLVLEILHVFDTRNKVVENFISYKSFVDDFYEKAWNTSKSHSQAKNQG